MCVVCRVLCVVVGRSSLCIVRRAMVDVCWFVAACGLWCGACCVLLVVCCCLWIVGCCLVFGVRCVFFGSCCLLLFVL